MSRSVLFHGVGQSLEIVESPPLIPTGAEIRVDVTYCTLCRSDLHTYSGTRTEPTPLILGHEIVGTISEFGPKADLVDANKDPLKIGDRVTWAIVVGCRQCFFCSIDLPQKCRSLKKYGHLASSARVPNGGGLADSILLMPNTVIYRLPDTLRDPLAAPANCATSTVAAILRVANPGFATVAVIGAGVLGLYACAMLDAMGTPQIIAIDPNEMARRRALSFGATHTTDPNDPDWLAPIHCLTDGRGADLVLELAGSAFAVAKALELVRIGGQIVLAGTVSPTTGNGLDPEKIVRKCVTITGVHNYHPRDLGKALRFLEANRSRYPFESLIGPEYPLEEAEKAFQTALNSPGTRVAIRPQKLKG